VKTYTDNRIYLASRSPRRRELLRQIGIVFEILLMREEPRRGVDVDESPLAGEAPAAYVMRIAQAKAEAGWGTIERRRLSPYPVLSADTTVVFDGEIVGKPDAEQHAQQLLQRLSGKTHHVLTAIAVARREHVETALSTSAVEFRELDADEIRRYVATGEPLDKAGAYAIQGRGAVFVRAISGSYSGIMGLPLFETAELLRRFDVAPV
jgi:nucleoside triphosphate pyrophosphatase